MAESLGYQPNLLARSLVTKQTKMIGVIVPEISSHFISNVIKGVYRTANKAGYRDALEKNGVTMSEELIVPCDVTEKEAYNKTLDLLSAKNPPDAIYCGNDIVALGEYRAINDFDLSIPEDIALACFGEITNSDSLSISMTIVQQPNFELGSRALELLLDEMKDKKAKPRHIVLNTKLVIVHQHKRKKKNQSQ